MKDGNTSTALTEGLQYNLKQHVPQLYQLKRECYDCSIFLRLNEIACDKEVGAE